MPYQKVCCMYVYILTNSSRSVFYVGHTDDLQKRVLDHKKRRGGFFTSKYRIDRLVYYKNFDNRHEASKNEKAMKRWKKDWKIELISQFNPNWKDLFDFL